MLTDVKIQLITIKLVLKFSVPYFSQIQLPFVCICFTHQID